MASPAANGLRQSLDPPAMGPRRGPQGVWADPAASAGQAEPGSRAALLEQHAAQARRLGFSTGATQQLKGEAAEVRAAEQAAKSPGEKLLRLQERLATAQRKEEEARVAADKAQARFAEAAQHAARVRAEKAELEVEITRAGGSAVGCDAAAAVLPSQGQAALLTAGRVLLERLEGSVSRLRACGAELPEDVQEAVQQLHQIHLVLQPPRAGSLEGPLEPAGRASVETPLPGEDRGDAQSHADTLVQEEAVMQELDEVGEEASDAELAAIARRLKRARCTIKSAPRSAPY